MRKFGMAVICFLVIVVNVAISPFSLPVSAADENEATLIFNSQERLGGIFYVNSGVYQNEVERKLALADSYLGEYKYLNARGLYCEVLESDFENLAARVGLARIAHHYEQFDKANYYLDKILSKHPDYFPAISAKVDLMLADGQVFSSLDFLNKQVQTQDVKLKKAKIYLDMGLRTEEQDAVPENPYYNLSYQSVNKEVPMYASTQKLLYGSVGAEAEKLKTALKNEKVITLTPIYSLLIQRLAESYKLDVNRMGLMLSEVVDDNKNVFLSYNMYIYSSGKISGNQLNNVTNELKLGIQERVSEKFEYKFDIGAKFFQFGGVMANANSWVKYFVNDIFDVKVGFRRNNIEQSYLSAVGYPIDGIFTGQVADNKMYSEFQLQLPNNFYSFGRYGYSVVTGQNLQTNQYMEGLIGLGKVIYKDLSNKWINMVNLDLVSYNSSYQYDQLKIYNSAGKVYGGYFSPSFFTANTINIKAEGENKKYHLKYGLRGFVGAQVSLSPRLNDPIFGLSPYLSYSLNDRVSINIAYNYYNYADVQRDQVIVNAVIRGGKK